MSNKKKDSGKQRKSLGGTLLGIIVVVLAVIITQVTGIDVIGLLNNATGDQPPAAVEQPPAEAPPAAPGNVQPLTVSGGFGAAKGFWTVYFNAPTGESDASTYVNGIDIQLADAINGVERTLDIAAFEFNNEVLTEAVLNAHERGVQVRIVTDDEYGLEEEEESIPHFIEAGIPVVDDERSGLMHNKFMILDSQVVWTGSWNYTVNGTYRNNNNAVVLRSQRAVQAYQTEFNEMFEGGAFGTTSPEGTAEFTQDGTPVEILFASEDNVVGAIMDEINAAEQSVRFMAFSFTQDDIGEAMLQRAGNGIEVLGIFETRGSETQYSELTPLFCAGLDVRQDGNKYVLHHKVIIVDDDTVMTGSFNFSANATDSNDENLLIIKDPDFAAQYLAEFDRRFAEASPPPAGDIDCG